MNEATHQTGNKGAGEDLGADEGVLPVARLQDALDALLRGPRFAVRKLADEPRKFFVPHPRQAAAVGVERLERLEAEEACVSVRPNHLPLVHGAERVRAVFDDLQIVSPRQFQNRVKVAGHAVQVRRQHGASVRSDRPFHGLRAERERRRVDVGEHQRQSCDAANLGNHPERQGRNNDLGARRKVHGLQDEVERHAPVLRRHGAHVSLAAEETGELLLEGVGVWPLHQMFPFTTRADDLVLLGNHTRAKSCDSGHRLAFRMCRGLSGVEALACGTRGEPSMRKWP